MTERAPRGRRGCLLGLLLVPALVVFGAMIVNELVDKFEITVINNSGRDLMGVCVQVGSHCEKIPALRSGGRKELEFHAFGDEGPYVVTAVENGHETVLGACGYIGNPGGKESETIEISRNGVSEKSCTGGLHR